MTDRILLLRYKVRNCYAGNEMLFSPNGDSSNREWKRYKIAEKKSYELYLPDRPNFLLPGYFRKYEYYADGDPNPVAVYFRTAFVYNHIQAFHLPENYIEFSNDSVAWVNVQPSLQEYERCRDNWQTRVIVNAKR